MKVAIIGTSHAMTENEERDVQQFVAMILKHFDPTTTTIITGGAKGVDTMAQNGALLQGFAVKPFFPLGAEWAFYKKRNMEIASECDELFCITIPYYKNSNRKKCYHHKSLEDHQKTAGCYTLKICKGLNKPCKLLVTPNRQ